MTDIPTTTRRRAMALAALATAALALLPTGPLRAEAPPNPERWVIEAGEARALLEGGALLLDARDEALRAERPIPGATAVIWQAFTHPDEAIRGRLLDDDAALTETLRALGVSADRPVLAVADGRQGGGEDGRVVWTLRTLGHERAHLVDGGVDALLAAGGLDLVPAGRGDFTVARTDAYEATKEEVLASLGRDDVVILDTREAREYAGETPYGETRGGHVPGARHIHFRDLLAEDGTRLDGAALQARLAALGIGEGTEVVSCCTGGIRSGLVTAVLHDAGIAARNYAGSMWEWSAAPADAYPLVTD